MEFGFLTGKPGECSVSCRMLHAYHWPKFAFCLHRRPLGMAFGSFRCLRDPTLYTSSSLLTYGASGRQPGKAGGMFYRQAAETDDLYY